MQPDSIIRLVALHVGAEVQLSNPRVSAELPETGERFKVCFLRSSRGPPLLSESRRSPSSRWNDRARAAAKPAAPNMISVSVFVMICTICGFRSNRALLPI
jgi:hypothetical protein